ncbi:MAG: hypothetical protein ACR2JE_15635 [Acidobacteriaceae bacterium]
MHIHWQKRPTRTSYWLIIVAALVIGVVTALLGVGVDRMLHQQRPLFTSDLLEGSAAALLSGFVLLRLQRRKRDLLARIQAVEDVNHHVRNALTAVMYSAVLREDPVLNAIVEDANARIDWTLREVLPRTVASFRPSAAQRRWCSGLEVQDDAGDHVDAQREEAAAPPASGWTEPPRQGR